MWIKNIKDQTLVLLVSLTLGVTLVFSILAAIAAFVVEDSVISNFLGEEANQLEKYYAQHGSYPSGSVNFLEVFPSIEVMPQWVKSAIDPERMEGEIFTPDASHYHYRKLTLHDGRQGYLLAEVSRFLVVTHQPRLWIIFLVVFCIAVISAIFMAIKFSQKIVNPILSLTTAVKSNEQPATAMRLPHLAFELGYLSDAMQASFDKLNEHLEKEKAFSTNVSHELRTPLTVLKNSCTLIAQRGFTQEDLQQIKNSSEQMEHTVNVLLALARTETLAVQACNLLMTLEQAVLRCHTSALEDFQIHLDIPQEVTLIANPNLLHLLFVNLLRNAVAHASEPMIAIAYAHDQLIFDNKVEALPDVDLTKAGIKSDKSDGIGQGLYLVARIAENFGWKITVDNSLQRFRVLINFQ